MDISKINGYDLQDTQAREALENKADIDHEHPKFVTHDEIDHLVTITREEINEKADKDHHHDDLYLKKEEIDSLVTNDELELKYNNLEIMLNDLYTHMENELENTEELINLKINELIDSAPDAMNTLKELANAINNNKDVYDSYISTITKILEEKANINHTHSEYALLDHEHDKYLEEHQDLSHLASKNELDDLNKTINLLSLKLDEAFIQISELEKKISELEKQPTDKPEQEEKEKFLLEYTIESYNDSESILAEMGSGFYRYLPIMYKTSDKEYDFMNNITLVLNDDTETTDLETYASSVKKIKILYDYDIYRIRFSSKSTVENFGHGVKEILEINTSNLRSMSTMFWYCKNLKYINMNNFLTSNVTTMVEMFAGCSSLTTLDLSTWDTSNVTSMKGMFLNCKNLTSLNLSTWNTSNVKDMYGMFSSCSSITSLDLSNFDVSNVTNLRYTFYNCSLLKFLDLSTWDTSKVNQGSSDANYMLRDTYIADWNYNGDNYKKFTITEYHSDYQGKFPWKA